MNDAPIGIFDSGIGGLTVARAIYERLPAESTIYFGDTARVPYGPKSPETVRRYSREILDWLLGQGVKAVVVACNTATAHALDDLRAASPVPVLGVIEPGARAVGLPVGLRTAPEAVPLHDALEALALRRPGDIDLVADGQLRRAARQAELFQGDAALGLQPDVNYSDVLLDADNGALDHTAFLERRPGERLFKQSCELVAARMAYAGLRLGHLGSTSASHHTTLPPRLEAFQPRLRGRKALRMTTRRPSRPPPPLAKPRGNLRKVMRQCKMGRSLNRPAPHGPSQHRSKRWLP